MGFEARNLMVNSKGWVMIIKWRSESLEHPIFETSDGRESQVSRLRFLGEMLSMVGAP